MEIRNFKDVNAQCMVARFENHVEVWVKGQMIRIMSKEEFLLYEKEKLKEVERERKKHNRRCKDRKNKRNA